MYTATWWVNLLGIASIHHVTIYFMLGNYPWGSTSVFTAEALGFSLYVSNTTNKLDGILCFQDTEFNTSTIPAVFNVTCTVHGQYVIFYNERLPGVTYPDGYSKFAYNDICEVEVFGCPRAGFYGIDCSIPCPEQCSSYCDIEVGTCEECHPGYQGQQCELGKLIEIFFF
uniref:Uncharacterized protein LOC111113150 isoform X2 n=1 Tax=Crassostrea virginica TaxID=6565 RepID=A0A8B8BU27_CRAVI|nr:uncharacterized protein LOC111113150 isoform X2 [Crassostrea virginica]